MKNFGNYDILVTGATGFVGKVLIKKLVKKFGNKKILCLVYNQNSHLELEGRSLLDKLGVSYIRVNLTDLRTIPKFEKEQQLVIHLAAETDTSKRNHMVNYVGVKNLYDSLKSMNNCHFIHIGTMIEVVGRPNCSKPIDENSKNYPTNEYTRTKLAGENFIIGKCIKDKFKLTVIRPNTIYGKGVRKNSLFDIMREMIKKHSLITRINWPGKSALIHVDDLTNIIMQFAKSAGLKGKPQKYLAYGENLTIFEISKIIHLKLNIPFRPIVIPNIVWGVIRYIRKFIPYFENILPYNFYNSLWRLGIIVDNVVWCKSSKLSNKLKYFKFIKFKDAVNEVV